MIELVAERGFSGVTIRGLSGLAGVSTRSFYECFTNVEDCFVATYIMILRNALARPRDSHLPHTDRLRARLLNFFGYLESNPKAAHLALVDALSTGTDLVANIRTANRLLERSIAEDLAAVQAQNPIPAALIHGAAAAALQLARSRLLSESVTGPTSVIADEFADWLVSLRGDCSLVWSDVDLQAGSAFDTPPGAPRPGCGDDRRFLLAAVTKLGMRDGYSKLTIPAIRREAGVSRPSFDARFAGVADCFLAAVESRITAATDRAAARARGAETWEAGVVRATAGLCIEIKRDAALARLGYTEILAPGGPGLELQDRTFARLSRRLRGTAPPDTRPNQLAATASVVAAIAAVGAGRREGIGRLAPTAAFILLAPAVGADAAGRAIRSEMAPASVA